MNKSRLFLSVEGLVFPLALSQVENDQWEVVQEGNVFYEFFQEEYEVDMVVFYSPAPRVFYDLQAESLPKYSFESPKGETPNEKQSCSAPDTFTGLLLDCISHPDAAMFRFLVLKESGGHYECIGSGFGHVELRSIEQFDRYKNDFALPPLEKRAFTLG